MKVISKNRKAGFDNELIEKYIAGIVLEGQEVKSVKSGEISINGAYVMINRGKCTLRGAQIPLWSHANTSSSTGYQPDRNRTLLLKKKQLVEIESKREQLHAQIIPVAVLLDRNLIKIEIALGRPLRKYDQRKKKKELDEKRATERIAKTVQIIR